MLPQNAEHLLPQKFPFQLIDTLTESSEAFIKTTFNVPEVHVLVDKSYLCEGGLIENVAQSAAAGTGYYYTSQGKGVPIGYIGAVKNVLIHRLPKAGDQLHTELVTMNQIGNASIVKGTIFLEKEIIASCELTIFVAN